ncbi:hypothetical protein TNCV_2195651 [Trichonephila clavipes]|nr:hypothetical protein TNCV_2195651 [Trichonephila clavipes]
MQVDESITSTLSIGQNMKSSLEGRHIKTLHVGGRHPRIGSDTEERFRQHYGMQHSASEIASCSFFDLQVLGRVIRIAGLSSAEFSRLYCIMKYAAL